MYPADGPHGGLYGFGLPGIGGSHRTENMPDAEPVGRAQDGSQIAGILDIVQRQAQRLGNLLPVERTVRLAEDGQHPLRASLQAGLLEFVVTHFDHFLGPDAGMLGQPLWGGRQKSAGEQRQQFFGQLVAFGREQSVFCPDFLLFQGMYPFEFGFAQHDWRFCVMKTARSI